VLGCTTLPRRFSHGLSLFDPTAREPLVIGGWSRFAILTPGRIDVVLDTGQVDSYDRDWREISTPLPTAGAAVAMEGMSRFHAR
jgi:membrane-anchored protein YejM (alkaline phosphatase superfamily)